MIYGRFSAQLETDGEDGGQRQLQFLAGDRKATAAVKVESHLHGFACRRIRAGEIQRRLTRSDGHPRGDRHEIIDHLGSAGIVVELLHSR